MAKPLQQIRKEAGYRSAREFADACGFTQSTMTRYEKEPDNIPVKAAWRIADVLGCTIDVVVGRESEVTADLRGEVQARYDALAPSLRKSLDDYLSFLETRESEPESACHGELEECYMDLFKVYLLMFLEDKSRLGRDEALPDGSSDQIRERFLGFVNAKAIERSEVFTENEEVIEGVMRAYDRFYPKPHGLPGL